MASHSGWLRAALAAAFATAVGATSAIADPIVGPFTCTILTGGTNTCTATGSAPTTTWYHLWVQNGDDDTPRIVSGDVMVNGTTEITSEGFALGQDLMQRWVHLSAGPVTVQVTINGNTGQYVGTTLLPQADALTVTQGRLLVAYADAANLTIDLKNGSHKGARSYLVVFYDVNGNYVADSGTIGLEGGTPGPLPVRGSITNPVASFIQNGTWTSGSIEVFYSGAGRGRLWGQVVTTEAGVSTIAKMDEAGSRLIDPLNPQRRTE
jgi:hypothetical protein